MTLTTLKLDVRLFDERVNFSLWQCTSPKITDDLWNL